MGIYILTSQWVFARGFEIVIRMNRVHSALIFPLCGVVLLSESLFLGRAGLRLRRPLVLRGGFKNMFGEEQCRNFSRGEAGASNIFVTAQATQVVLIFLFSYYSSPTNCQTLLGQGGKQ